MPSLKSLLKEFGHSASGFALPSKESRAIGLQTFETYVAPSDGWLVAYSFSESDGFLGFYAYADGKVQCRSAVPTRLHVSAAVFLPLRKGMEVRRDGDAPSEIYFIPMVGES